MKILAKMGVASEHMSRVFFVVACIVFVSMVIIVLSEVMMRYLFDSPIVWACLTSSLALGITTFLSVAWIQKREEHVKMDLLVTRLSIRNQALLKAVTSMLAVLGLLVVVWYSAKCAMGMYLTRELFGDQPFDLLKVPFLAVVPIGIFVLALQVLKGAFISLHQALHSTETKTPIESDTSGGK